MFYCAVSLCPSSITKILSSQSENWEFLQDVVKHGPKKEVPKKWKTLSIYQCWSLVLYHLSCMVRKAEQWGSNIDQEYAPWILIRSNKPLCLFLYAACRVHRPVPQICTMAWNKHHLTFSYSALWTPEAHRDERRRARSCKAAISWAADHRVGGQHDPWALRRDWWTWTAWVKDSWAAGSVDAFALQ